MKLKIALATVAAATLTGAVLIGTAQAQGCIYSQQGSSSAPISNPTVDPTTTQVNLGNSNGISKFGIGAAGLGILLGGGLLLRFARKSEPLPREDSSQELPELTETVSPASKFAIEIPPEVMQSLQAKDADAAPVTSAR